MKTGFSMRGLDGPSPTEYRRERVSTRKETAMPETRTRTVVLLGASLYLAVMSFAGGVATERRLADGSSAGADASPEVR